MKKQDAPFTIQIELSFGCNIRVPRSDGTKGFCEACGINAVVEKPGIYKFMTVATAETVAKQIAASGWTSQLLFAQHGEPSMNPNMREIIGIFRKHLPKAYMVMLTNGGGFIKEDRLNGVFEAGLNVLAFDDYEGAGLVERVPFEKANYTIRHYPSDKEANPHHRTKKQYIVLIDDIKTATKGNHSVLNNHAGSGMAPNQNFWGKKCAKPFREVGVRWDGTVSGCCIDWRNIVEVGNTNETALEELWNGPVFQAMRRILIKGDRKEIELCSGCDHPSYRVGLLPDKFGKETLPMWTDEDVSTIVNAGKQRKNVVKFFPRAWHKQGEVA